jgi:hypothetical protein
MAAPTYRTIYLLCPARLRTGGPEALHQLGRALLDFGHDARMVYYSSEWAKNPSDLTPRNGVLGFPAVESPMPPEYAHYQVPGTFQIDDDERNALVFSEVCPWITRSFGRLAPYLWWLSIDNSLPAVRAFGGFAAIRAARCNHLCQSYYALEFLAGHDIHGLPLFDYISPEHIAAAAAAHGPRDDRVLYAARGRWFAEWLIRLAPDLQWRELSGLTPAEIQALFLTSKIYIDFGHHPGKDRMPREAAILGCCILVGKSGSAVNAFDVPIPARYKFHDSRRLNGRSVLRAIRATMADFDNRTGDFAPYRRLIEGEQGEFLAQVASVFGGRLQPWPHRAAPGGRETAATLGGPVR